jgi:flagellar biosynthetic protein FliP
MPSGVTTFLLWVRSDIAAQAGKATALNRGLANGRRQSGQSVRKRRHRGSRPVTPRHTGESKPDRKFAFFALQSVGVLVLVSSLLAQSSAQGQSPSDARARANGGSVADSATPPLPSAAPQNDAASDSLELPIPLDFEEMLSPDGLTSTLKIMLLMTVLSLAPSILIMTTCFIRFVVVLGLLRQALGTQQLPPNQVVISLCLFLTIMVMAPVWTDSYEQGIRPYTDPPPNAAAPSLDVAFENTVRPLRQFMEQQIRKADNGDAVLMFLKFRRPNPDSPEADSYQEPENYEEIPLSVLLPSYMMSELKVAFVIGFQIYLPFLIIDMVVSSVLISMGMMMLPPVLISLPFKLLLFIMIDGWFLTVGMLLESVRPFG